MKFRVEDGAIVHSSAVGLRIHLPVSMLYADSKELPTLTEADGVRHRQNPHRIDLVFAAGEKVVGVESKKMPDLVTSWRRRRLARQFRTLFNEVDVPVLVVRVQPYDDCMALVEVAGVKPTSRTLGAELAAFQALGGIILFTHNDDKAVYDGLMRSKGGLEGARSVLSVVAGRDRPRKANRGPGWFLQGLRGIGPETAMRLHAKYGSTLAALNGFEGWSVARKVKEEVKEAMQ